MLDHQAVRKAENVDLGPVDLVSLDLFASQTRKAVAYMPTPHRAPDHDRVVGVRHEMKVS
jgi:hypothetical protein